MVFAQWHPWRDVNISVAAIHIQGAHTFPCKVLRSNSRFLAVASATGMDTGVPVCCPVA